MVKIYDVIYPKSKNEGKNTHILTYEETIVSNDFFHCVIFYLFLVGYSFFFLQMLTSTNDMPIICPTTFRYK